MTIPLGRWPGTVQGVAGHPRRHQGRKSEKEIARWPGWTGAPCGGTGPVATGGRSNTVCCKEGA